MIELGRDLLKMTAAAFKGAAAAISGFLPVILGFLILIFLMLMIRRLRRRRRLKKMPAHPAAGGGGPDAEAAEELPEADELYQTDDVLAIEEPEASSAAPAGAETPTVETAEPPFEEMPAPEIEDDGAGWLNRLKNGLSKTRQSFSRQIETVLSSGRGIDEEGLEQIEEALITADVGVDTTMALMQRLAPSARSINDMAAFKELLKTEMQSLIDYGEPVEGHARPWVVMVVGVNGVGKTTTIGKLAAKYRAIGKKVILGAADTFRAAAVEQLEVWAERSDSEIVKHRDKADPAAVAYDAVQAALARDADIVIIDTAGRLHTKVNLMEQLKKIKRTIGRQIPEAPHEILLVVDATTGQNAVSQAKLFHQDMGVTGIALTKLDGTAKGGIVLGISHTLNIPIRYIGVGEKISDLQPFDPRLFIDALL